MLLNYKLFFCIIFHKQIFIQSTASYVPIKNPSLTSGTESDDSGTAKPNNKVVRFNKVAEVIQF